MKLTTEQTLAVIKKHNEWRRGADIEQLHPTVIGEALDHAVKVLEERGQPLVAHDPRPVSLLKPRLHLFFTGVIQVFFVAINTCFLAKAVYIGVFLAAFAISLIWAYNVKRVVFGTIYDRLIYAFGAAVGSVIGLFASSFIS